MKSLRIWTGPVASEKTTKALYAAKRLMRMGSDLVLIRPPCSRRAHEGGSDMLVTKGGEKWPCIEVRSALDLADAAEDADAVWLDGPFMFEDQKKLYKVVKRILKKADVLISTIAATSELEPISSSISALLAIADEIHHCRADCDDCQYLGSASRSFHLAGPKTEKVKTGGEESYEPKCPACWTERTRKHRKVAQIPT
jgi:thymidine kinase